MMKKNTVECESLEIIYINMKGQTSSDIVKMIKINEKEPEEHQKFGVRINDADGTSMIFFKSTYEDAKNTFEKRRIIYRQYGCDV